MADAVETSARAPRQRIRRWLASSEGRFLIVLLAIFLAKGVIVSFVHVPFSGHDEVAHYAYLDVLATEHRIPVIPDLEDWQEAKGDGRSLTFDRMPERLFSWCRFVTSDWSANCGRNSQPVYAATWQPGGPQYPHGWIYTANHPPLYYLTMVPVYWAVNDFSMEMQSYLFRLATLPYGVLTVVMAYLTARTLFPRDRFMTLTVPTFVAFQPQISYEAAMLNNDAAAIAFTSVTIYLLVQGLKNDFQWGNVALIGFAFGLASLSKNTSLTMGLAIACAMILGLGVRSVRQWVPKGLLAGGIASLMVLPWFTYMHRTYGDFTALDRVSELQVWNQSYAESGKQSIWSQLTDRDFFWLRWRETWGEFGWRRIELWWNGDQGPFLHILLWVVALGAIGIAVWAIRLWRSGRLLPDDIEPDSPRLAPSVDPIFTCARWQVVGVLTMGLTCLVAYYAILQFGVTFSLTQARYYFPAIVPASVLLMLGYRSLLPRRWLPAGQVAIFAAMVILNVYIYTAYVLPYWATRDRTIPSIDAFYK